MTPVLWFLFGAAWGATVVGSIARSMLVSLRRTYREALADVDDNSRASRVIRLGGPT